MRTDSKEVIELINYLVLPTTSYGSVLCFTSDRRPQAARGDKGIDAILIK